MSNDVFPFAVWLSGTNQNSIPANDNALRVEVITGPALSILSVQPATPAEGDQHILGATPTGVQWSSFAEGDVVIFKGGAWFAFSPYPGWMKFNEDDGDVYQWDAGWSVFAGGGGGLTNFTESVNNSSPNTSIPVVRLIATNAATHVDIALTPKGNGSLLAQIPDASITAGDKRGLIAVDFQRVRAAANQVAGGIGSVLVGGQNNRASGDNAFAMGQAAHASGNQATALGNATTASGQNSIAMGDSTVADSENGSAIGAYATTRSVPSAKAHASGRLSATGDAQTREFSIRTFTSSATTTPLTTSGSGVSAASNQVNLPSNIVIAFEALVSCKQNGAGIAKAWRVDGAIQNLSGTVTLLGTPTVTVLGEHASATAWTIAAAADNTNKGLQINATGADSTNISWSGFVRTVEIATAT